MHKDFVDWMSGYMMGFDDLSDGAWQQVAMEGVAQFNKDHGTHIDQHDGWLYWIKRCGEFKEMT